MEMAREFGCRLIACGSDLGFLTPIKNAAKRRGFSAGLP